MSRKTRNIIIICIAAALLAAGTVALAEFTRSSRAKRVAVTAGSVGMMFSSNYLGIGDIAQNKNIVFSSSSEGGVSTVVTVCNYPQGNPTRYYDRAINYVLRAVLTDADGTLFRISGIMRALSLSPPYKEKTRSSTASAL